MYFAVSIAPLQFGGVSRYTRPPFKEGRLLKMAAGSDVIEVLLMSNEYRLFTPLKRLEGSDVSGLPSNLKFFRLPRLVKVPEERDGILLLANSSVTMAPSSAKMDFGRDWT